MIVCLPYESSGCDYGRVRIKEQRLRVPVGVNGEYCPKKVVRAFGIFLLPFQLILSSMLIRGTEPEVFLTVSIVESMCDITSFHWVCEYHSELRSLSNQDMFQLLIRSSRNMAA